MRLSINVVKRWIAEHGPSCTVQQLDDLDQALSEARAKAKESESRYAAAVAQAEAAAKAVGLTLEQLLRVASGGGAAPVVVSPLVQQGRPGAPMPRTGVRKPYVNPVRDDGNIYAYKATQPEPEWLKEAKAAGFTLADCKYDRIAEARAARKLPPLYGDKDPKDVHADRVKAEPVRYQRKRRPER